MFSKKKVNRNLVELNDSDKVFLIQVLKKEWKNLVDLQQKANVQDDLDLYLSVNARIKQCDDLVEKFNC